MFWILLYRQMGGKIVAIVIPYETPACEEGYLDKE
jgi:hypothetical protein